MVRRRYRNGRTLFGGRDQFIGRCDNRVCTNLRPCFHGIFSYFRQANLKIAARSYDRRSRNGKHADCHTIDRSINESRKKFRSGPRKWNVVISLDLLGGTHFRSTGRRNYLYPTHRVKN